MTNTRAIIFHFLLGKIQVELRYNQSKSPESCKIEIKESGIMLGWKGEIRIIEIKASQ